LEIFVQHDVIIITSIVPRPSLQRRVLKLTPKNNLIRHVKVYYETGRYGGWPANHGIWSWGNEILVGFVGGFHKEKTGHTIDPDKPKRHLFGRSFDGSETWSIEDGYENGIRGDSGNHTPAPGASFEPATLCPGNIDFVNPDFAMTLRRMDNNIGPSHFYYSYNRGKAWEGYADQLNGDFTVMTGKMLKLIPMGVLKRKSFRF
jgi:hypothetical protein